LGDIFLKKLIQSKLNFISNAPIVQLEFFASSIRSWCAETPVHVQFISVLSPYLVRTMFGY